jgi:HSP20 family molecular chaperone IbpA
MEENMNLRSLIPYRDRGSMSRGATGMPAFGVFGPLHTELDRLLDEFTRNLGVLSPQAGNALVPSMDITETDKDIEITVEMPGLERKDVEISFDDGVLTIRGEKRIVEGDGASAEEQGGAQQGRLAQGDEAPAGQAQGGQAQGRQAQGRQTQGTAGQATGESGSQVERTGQNGGERNRNKSYHVTERSYGVFLRMVQLPPAIDPSKIQATMSNGVLRIVIPKPQQNEAKKIEVKEAA